MGRCLPRQLSVLGWRVYDRMRALSLEAPAVAAAAGISSSTLYRIMRADRRGTAEPRLSTKRQLARALHVPMATLFDDEQLELVYEPPIQAPSHALSVSDLVVHHIRSVPEELRVQAIREAAFGLVDLVLTVGGATSLRDLGVDALTGDPSENLLLILLHSLPEKMRRVGCKVAIRAMLKVERAAGREPTKQSYACITRTTWSDKRLARDSLGQFLTVDS
jgi:transcriptional regulator with XRE-family HTH domain